MTISPLGYVQLTVSDLARSLAFYLEALGLQVRHRSNHTAELGTGQIKLLALTENIEAKRPGRTTGLYHFALRLPSRADLAGFVNHLIETQTPVEGVSDHQVSEAIYLPDPDGNGIEIYHDRPPDKWYNAAGNLILTTRPLNLEDVLAEVSDANRSWPGMPPGTVLGHIHLHVADLPSTRRFYVELLGMDLVAEYADSAMFFSWNGYHHHIGANTWNGVGAPTPPANAVGLRYFTLELEQEHLDEIQGRLMAAAVEIDEQQGGLFIRDPAGNGIALRLKDRPSQ
jgi:catechol 2,3-dioxygenase